MFGRNNLAKAPVKTTFYRYLFVPAHGETIRNETVNKKKVGPKEKMERQPTAT